MPAGRIRGRGHMRPAHNGAGRGLGFYCTQSSEPAKEWAVSSLRDGFSNCYTLETECLNFLRLNSPDYTILNWIAVLVERRLFSIKTWTP